jgi:hypothetical protein
MSTGTNSLLILPRVETPRELNELEAQNVFKLVVLRMCSRRTVGALALHRVQQGHSQTKTLTNECLTLVSQS